MSSNINLNMSNISDFNLSFLVNMGVSRWYQGEENLTNKLSNEDFKRKIPKNKIFEISSMIFNITKHRKETLNKYQCYFDEKSNCLFLILKENICFSEFTKEILMNLFDFSEKVEIDTICFLISKKNPQFIRILQDLMIVGFKSNEKIEETFIEGNAYKVMEIPVKNDQKIEEFFF